MEKETLRYEISYLEESFNFMANSRKSLEDNIKVIIKSSTNNRKNIKQLKSTKNRFCENVGELKNAFEKLVETLKKYIDGLKKISTELESSDIRSVDETNKYFKSNLVTRQSLEKVFSDFTTIYSQVCANLKFFESLLQKENGSMKSYVKCLLEQFKILENEMTKIETERKIKVKKLEELKVRRLLFCQNQIQQLEEETVKLKEERIDSITLENEKSSILCSKTYFGRKCSGKRRRWGYANRQQRLKLRLDERDRKVQSLERQVEEYRREINELKEQVENLNR